MTIPANVTSTAAMDTKDRHARMAWARSATGGLQAVGLQRAGAPRSDDALGRTPRARMTTSIRQGDIAGILETRQLKATRNYIARVKRVSAPAHNQDGYC